MKRIIPGGPLFQVPDLPSIPDIVLNAAKKYPDRIAVQEPAELGKFKSISYRQFCKHSSVVLMIALKMLWLIKFNRLQLV